LFSFGLLLLLWCFSTLGNDYFEVLFNKKIISSDQKNGCKYRDIVPLNTFQNGKSPGDDGYTAEFYKQFFSLLGQDLVNSLNVAFDIGEMSVSQRRGVITLLPKEDANLLDYRL